MVELRAVLPAEEGAVVVVAALTAARDQFGTSPDQAVPGPSIGEAAVADQTPPYTNADALVDVAEGFLATAPEDRSGEDRNLVVVHVSTDTLVEDEKEGVDERKNVPAATCQRPAGRVDPAADPVDEAEETGDADGVPGGTSADPFCQVAGVAAVEAETARRLACDVDLLGAVVDRHGDVLALGSDAAVGVAGAVAGVDDPGPVVPVPRLSAGAASAGASSAVVGGRRPD